MFSFSLRQTLLHIFDDKAANISFAACFEILQFYKLSQNNKHQNGFKRCPTGIGWTLITYVVWTAVKKSDRKRHKRFCRLKQFLCFFIKKGEKVEGTFLW